MPQHPLANAYLLQVHDIMRAIERLQAEQRIDEYLPQLRGQLNQILKSLEAVAAVMRGL